MAEGEPTRAATAFLDEARAGTARDTSFYNAGTAALSAGRLDVARGALAEAAKSLDPGLRYRALYNLGVVSLLAARADSAHRDELLGQASDHLREALSRSRLETREIALLIAEARRRRLDVSMLIRTGTAVARWNGSWRTEKAAFSPGWAIGLSVQPAPRR